MILVTNNEDVVKQWNERNGLKIDRVNSPDMLEVLYHVRDLLHRGHWLLTHPFTGSLKPNENPYKSVLVSSSTDELNMDHVVTVEQCIEVAQKSLTNRAMPDYSEQMLQDFRFIDKNLINNGIQRALESGE